MNREEHEARRLDVDLQFREASLRKELAMAEFWKRRAEGEAAKGMVQFTPIVGELRDAGLSRRSERCAFAWAVVAFIFAVCAAALRYA